MKEVTAFERNVNTTCKETGIKWSKMQAENAEPQRKEDKEESTAASYS